jgi:hypothetical protein
MLAIPDKLYEQKLPYMCLLLNGTDSRKGYGYGTVAMVKQSKEKFGIRNYIKKSKYDLF